MLCCGHAREMSREVSYSEVPAKKGVAQVETP